MAKKDAGKADALSIVRSLVQAADGDTAFRDLYLEHAAAQLAAAMPEGTYRALCASQPQIDVLVRQTQAAVQRQDWPRVKELSAQAEALRRSLQQNATLIDLAHEIYDAEPVKVDPFSPGLADLGGARTSAAAVRDALVTTLAGLAKTDPTWAEFYGERQQFFKAFAVSAGPAKTDKDAPKANLADLQQRARAAAANGEVGRLQELAEQIMRLSEEAKKAAATAPSTPDRPTAAADVGRRRVSVEPFPAPCLDRARALGLEHVHLQAVFPELSAAVSEFLARHAWQPQANVEDLAKEGTVHLRAQLATLPLPAEAKEPFVELAALFSLRPFVNSGGVRYFPPEPGEHVLLETFSEDADPPQSELLSFLGLQQRRALSRVEIELALRRRGPALLEERLGLSPREFRVVCVPFDVYARAGQERGWGRQPQWTHVDGYAVTQRGRLGALAAGDVRYGGLYDLVILSATDQRDSVIARFAVIRRSRLQAG